MMDTKSTCQICGREIKANTGLIAHHGYQRPGEGWQTPSCYGARFQPYEVSHDRLDWWIKLLRDKLIPQRTTILASYRANPPDSYIVGPKDSYGRYRWQRTVTRPESFDTSKSPGSWTPYSYEGEFWSNVHRMERDIKGMAFELDRSAKRRGAWKSPFRSDIAF